MLLTRDRDIGRRRLAPLVLLVAVVGCTPGATSSGDDDEPDDEALPAATVTIPPVRLTPFCQAMIDLADRIENDPPDDVEAEIIDTYEGIQPEVPDEIREDFDAVLAALRDGEAARAGGDDAEVGDVTTTSAPTADDPTGSSLPPGDPFFDEGYSPDDDPALRLNAYVDFECRDVANNPGPPPTQPLEEPTTTEG